jgi:hypothetical protein
MSTAKAKAASTPKGKVPSTAKGLSTPNLTKRAPTEECLSAAIEYVQGKISGGLITKVNKTTKVTSKNVVHNFILMLNERGFPYLTEDKLKLFLDLFTSKIQIPQMRTALFNAIQSWTKIKISNIPTAALRAGTAFEGKPLDDVTKESEGKIGHPLETIWDDISASSTKCTPVEINFILEIAIKNASNVEKDKRLRGFIYDYLSNSTNKKQMKNIIDSIEAETRKASPVNRKNPQKQMTDVGAFFNSGEFSINKKACGICWICSFPIYIYQIEHTPSKNTQQLNTCGEMEHVLPPGPGSIIGTLSAKADTMIDRLQNAKDVLIGFGLRASHALCNKLKSDLVFLIAVMSGAFMIGGFEIDNTRLAEFVEQIVNKLKGTDGSKQSPWNYELQFRYGELDLKTIVDLNAKKLYPYDATQALLKTPDEFGKGCSENIKKMMTELSAAAVQINTASIKEKFPDLSGPISSQLTLRTALYSVIFWHDILKGSNNNAAKAYQTVWDKFNKKPKSGAKSGGGIEENLDASFDDYMKCMSGSIETAKIEKKIKNPANSSLCSLPIHRAEEATIEILEKVIDEDIEVTDNGPIVNPDSESQLENAVPQIERIKQITENLNVPSKNHINYAFKTFGMTNEENENWRNEQYVKEKFWQQYDPYATASYRSPSAAASSASSANNHNNSSSMSGLSKQYASHNSPSAAPSSAFAAPPQPSPVVATSFRSISETVNTHYNSPPFGRQDDARFDNAPGVNNEATNSQISKKRMLNTNSAYSVAQQTTSSPALSPASRGSVLGKRRGGTRKQRKQRKQTSGRGKHTRHCKK